MKHLRSSTLRYWKFGNIDMCKDARQNLESHIHDFYENTSILDCLLKATIGLLNYYIQIVDRMDHLLPNSAFREKVLMKK